MSNNLEHMLACQCRLGEGPLWSVQEQALYWLDIHQAAVHRLEPKQAQHTQMPAPAAVTALGLCGGGGFVAATLDGFALLDQSIAVRKVLGHPEAAIPNNRFNDGAVDPQGRFWAGTMYEGPQTDQPTAGSLYCLTADGQITCMETGLTIANGMGWSPDGRTFYLTDTLRHTIYAYDYVADSGLIRNRRILIHDPDEPGWPDGLAVDSAGFLWSARWGGWTLRRYDPDGHLERKIEVPVECPSSCAFGGPELNELYITSAWTFLDANQRAAQPFAGDLFRIRLDVPGMSANQFGDRR